ACGVILPTESNGPVHSWTGPLRYISTLLLGLANLPRLHPSDVLNRAAPQSSVPRLFRGESAHDQGITVFDLRFPGSRRCHVADRQPESILGEHVLRVIAV